MSPVQFLPTTIYGQYHRSQKPNIIEYERCLKNQIAGSNATIKDKLDDIVIRIQRRLNKGKLKRIDISKYRNELNNLLTPHLTDEIKKNIEYFFQSCIFLSTHRDHDNGGTKTNWFDITRQSTSITSLLDNTASMRIPLDFGVCQDLVHEHFKNNPSSALVGYKK